MNRAQQAYYLEKQDFVGETTDIGKLGLGIATNTQNYSYVIKGDVGASNNTKAANIGQPAKAASATVRAYVGGVQIGTQAATSEATTLAVLCQGEKAPAANGGTPTGEYGAIGWIAPGAAGAPSCVPGYVDLGK
ncbi:MAG TPA: general secretion pathway protein GspH, partial [Cyanobacteria bacterium UBA9273]|nr:general secretion pathway protein GspH [Cyanobacteria bacterium UBA9273]